MGPDKKTDTGKNRVLVFIDWYRPGYRAGGPITSVANLVARLKGEFTFHILTRDRDLGEKEPYEGISANEWIRVSENVHACYLSEKMVNRNGLEQKALEAGCGTWLVNGIYSWYFSVLPLLLAKKAMRRTADLLRAEVKPSHVVVSARGMLSPHALARKGLKKRIFLRAARAWRLYKGVTLHASTEQEAKEIASVLGKNVPVRVAPNMPLPVVPETPAALEKQEGSLALVILGRISPEKNTLQAIRILSRAGPGEISVQLVGAIGDEDYWGECQHAMKELPSRITVRHTGAVHPSAVPGILERVHMLFLPTTGENYGHAIVESLAHGVPALISNRTPWNDLEPNRAGWSLPLSDSPGFVRILDTCLAMGPDEFERMRRNARTYAQRILNDPGSLELNMKLLDPTRQ